MRASLFPLVLLGCGGPPPAPMYNGGSIMLAQCGYSVVTRDQATAPAMGSPMIGADGTPWGIHLGLAADPARNVVVDWRTRDEATLATTVQFGVGADGPMDQSVDGLVFSYVSNGAAQEKVQVHETHLCGLQPGTVYHYRVGGKAGAVEKWSDTFTFRTAPDKGDAAAQVTLAVLGDSRDATGAYDVLGGVLAQAEATATPDLVVFTGDFTMIASDQPEWDHWFDKAQPVLAKVPLLSVLGNHEINDISYYTQLALPGDEEYWSLDYGPVHLVALNDSPQSSDDVTGKGKTFLDSDLAANEARPWKLATHHKAIYSSSTHGGDATLLANWAPVLDQHKVDLDLNSHDHDYERSKPMRANMPQATPADGTIYLVQGGAGADLYGNATTASTAFSSKTYGFTILKVRVGQLGLKAYDDKGTVIDSLDITK